MKKSVKFIIKNLVFIFLSIICIPNIVENKILRYKHFAESQRIIGGSGKIYSMNSYTISKKNFSLALHRFDISFNYGATENIEIGTAFNLKEMQNSPNFIEGMKKISPFLKYHIMDSSKDLPFDLTLGFYQTTGIFVVEKLLPKLYSTSIGTNLNFSPDKQQKFYYTIMFSKYTKWVEFIFDFNITNEIYAFGGRYLLTPEMQLDLFFHNLKNITNILFDNFIFGITIRL